MNEANKSKSDVTSERSERVTYSLTSELHEKLLTATNEIISLASSKKCSNAISTFEKRTTTNSIP